MTRPLRSAASVLLAAILTLAPGSAGPQFASAQTSSVQEAIPCRPEAPPAGTIVIGPNGITSTNPAAAEIIEDQVVSQPMNIGAEFPQLAGGTDGSLGDAGCDVSFDIEDPVPMMAPPSQLLPTLPAIPTAGTPMPPLPPISFSAPAACLQSTTGNAGCGPALDCRLPFCGRDIIFIHGLITQELEDLLAAKHSSSSNPAIGTWPQHAALFTSPAGYFRSQAEGDWQGFIVNKLGPTYKAAQVGYGPRFLVVAWPSTQRMEFGLHATARQIVDAMQTGARVQTLDMSLAKPRPVDAGLLKPGFCGHGCVIVSYSTGAPLAIATMNVIANGSRSWVTPSLRALPAYVKGHVAFHGALGGSELAFHALSLAGGSACPFVVDMLTGLSSTPWVPSGVGLCAIAQDLSATVLYDLAPPVMASKWRPVMQAVPVSKTVRVPTVLVAGGHPTKAPLYHWAATVLPGYDDGVLSVDSQLGRPWQLGAMPRALSLNDWGLFGMKYYDRGSPTAKAVPYFLDQNAEALRQRIVHAAAPNPFLSPNGMIFKSVSLAEIPAGSTGLPEVFSFLQSTAPHMFVLDVGAGGDSQPNDASDGCAAGSFSYNPTGNYFGAQAAVREESRAVFDSSVYGNRGRNHLNATEAVTGTIPLLSTKLANAIEGEVKGRYIKIRFKIGTKILFEKVFWIWKREYMRMRDWRCRDEIDYALSYAFRR